VKKSSNVAKRGNEIFREAKLTIGLDLGDRTSHYCKGYQVRLKLQLPEFHSTCPLGEGSSATRTRIRNVIKTASVSAIWARLF
jgi:hypothetical protein